MRKFALRKKDKTETVTEWVNLREASKLLGITPKMLKYEIEIGKLPYRELGKIKQGQLEGYNRYLVNIKLVKAYLMRRDIEAMEERKKNHFYIYGNTKTKIKRVPL